MISVALRTLAAGASAMTLGAALSVATIPAASARDSHPDATTLNAQTLRDLSKQAMPREAFANARYTLYAAQAARERLPSVANVFSTAAQAALFGHFTQEAQLYGLVGKNAQNLHSTLAWEEYETRVLYPKYAADALQAGDRNAAAAFTEIVRDETARMKSFQAAMNVVEAGHGKIPAPPVVTPVPDPAGPAKIRSTQTLADLDSAMVSDALAHAEYTLYAESAAARGWPRLARLFAGTAAVELREHFTTEAVLAGLVGRTRLNLEAAINTENWEAHIMYRSFGRKADAVGDMTAAALFWRYSLDEAGRSLAFTAALNTLP